MVGDGGAKEIRRLLFKIAGNTFTSIDYWGKQTLSSLVAWAEVINEELSKNVEST